MRRQFCWCLITISSSHNPRLVSTVPIADQSAKKGSRPRATSRSSSSTWTTLRPSILASPFFCLACLLLSKLDTELMTLKELSTHHLSPQPIASSIPERQQHFGEEPWTATANHNHRKGNPTTDCDKASAQGVPCPRTSQAQPPMALRKIRANDMEPPLGTDCHSVVHKPETVKHQQPLLLGPEIFQWLNDNHTPSLLSVQSYFEPLDVATLTGQWACPCKCMHCKNQTTVRLRHFKITAV